MKNPRWIGYAFALGLVLARDARADGAQAPSAATSPATSAARSPLEPKLEQELEQKVDRALDRALQEQRIVGAVVIVSRHGTVLYHKAKGLADREAGRPMRADTVFRLASMTKPIVSVAVLRLVEQGLVRLDDPVTKWLPEFRPKLADGSAPTITIEQLLSHTAGLGYRFLEPAGGPYHQLGVSDGLDASGITLDENLRRLARAPLLYAPGTGWRYSLALDVLGRVVEKVTKLDLAGALHKLVTGPLGLKDTGFIASQPERLATPYADGKPAPVRMGARYQNPMGAGTVDFSPARALDRSAYSSGGAGLVGTADDFVRFLEVIRSGGAPLLGRAMHAKILTSATGSLATLRGPGWGFSLAAAVVEDPKAARTPMSAGSIEWGGAYGHSWWVDPSAGLSVVILTNTSFEGMSGKLPGDIKAAVYGALPSR